MSARATVRTLAILTAGVAVALVLFVGNDGPAADEPKVEAKTEAKRKPWTTSKITGSPEPPPKFKATRVFPEAKFDHPLLIARCPGTERLFVGEQAGKIFSVKPGDKAKPELFVDLKAEIKTLDKLPAAKGVSELYGLVFHPKFEQNRYCYVCYTLAAKDAKVSRLPDGSRVSRFTVTKDEPPRIDPKSEEIVITFVGGGHNGGDLHFGPDGFLYISTGDASGPNPPDTLNTGQDCSDLLSSVLRIDINRKADTLNYAVPKDNPFVNVKDARPEIWAFGFRNPWRMSFDRGTGDLWLGDVGWELWEMVHKIEKGGNYGWSIVEGRQPIKPTQKIGPTPIRLPTIELPHTIAASITGGYVYRGKKFPELVGAYIFGDWETRRIWAARFENGRVKEMPEIVKPNIRVVAFGEDHAGELYFLDYDTGTMHTLERNDARGANAKFPTKLSETGLFADVKKHEMAEGIVRYKPNVKQWQDGANSQHFLALPNLSSVTYFEKPRQLPGQVFWHEFRMQFPTDAVLVKTISVQVPTNVRWVSVTRRLETQLLHFDGEDWHGFSYQWYSDESDAELVPPEGTETEVTVHTHHLPRGERLQTWTIHSRTQCVMCHNAWSEYTLAFTVPQLNCAENNFRVVDKEHPSQLVELSRDGSLRRMGKDNIALPAFDAVSAAKEATLVPTYYVRDHNLKPLLQGTVEQRARSYLHVNCAHCHRFGGGGGQVVLELDYAKPLKETGILDVRPKQGDFGIADARLIAPGDPGSSVLLYRMAKFGKGRMPHLGSEWPDHHGIGLVNEWICSLGKKPVVPAAKDLTGLDRAFTNFGTAFPFARGDFKEEDHTKVLVAAAKLEPGPVRDLFEGYLPTDPKGRKLGANPRPAAILALTGDAAKGEKLFFAKDLKCATCHKIGDTGVSLGPDLTAIGKTRSRPELLESLLQPSIRVEPQFAAYNVRTKDEKTYLGLLVKRDEKQVVLRDVENKEITLAADNVGAITPSRLSLMPDGQMQGLTPQEAADLLEYLVTRK